MTIWFIYPLYPSLTFSSISANCLTIFSSKLAIVCACFSTTPFNIL